MNEKTRNQIERMKNQTIGVEVEMNNITRKKLPKRSQPTSERPLTTQPPNTAT